MREILFRAKRLDNGEWVEGYYLQLIFFGIPIHMIAETDKSTCLNTFQIKPETLCQFTGLYDKNGLTRIWESDIIDGDGNRKGNLHEVQPSTSDLVIPEITSPDWAAAYQEAMERGCVHSK